MYGALSGSLPAKLVAFFSINDYTCENAVRRVAAVQMLSVVNNRIPLGDTWPCYSADEGGCSRL